jgi:putative membrane protein
MEWEFEPWLVVLMAASAIGYAIGLVRLWRNAGAGRGVAKLEAASFFAGWLALAAALMSPLDHLAEHFFSAHMVQHELLMVVAAPLMVLGRPLAIWTWALPSKARRTAGHAVHWKPWAALWAMLCDPVGAWAFHALALWGWHIPALFDAAVRSEGIHVAQHATFLVSALFFWWAVLGRHARPGHAAASLFTTMLHTTALGALLTVAPAPWYSAYSLPDQQLGGLIMWVPAGLVYVVAVLAVMGRMLVRLRA